MRVALAHPRPEVHRDRGDPPAHVGGHLEQPVLVVADAAGEHQQVLQVDGLHLPRRDACLRDRGAGEPDAVRDIRFVGAGLRVIRLAILVSVGPLIAPTVLAAGHRKAKAHDQENYRSRVTLSCSHECLR